MRGILWDRVVWWLEVRQVSLYAGMSKRVRCWEGERRRVLPTCPKGEKTSLMSSLEMCGWSSLTTSLVGSGAAPAPPIIALAAATFFAAWVGEATTAGMRARISPHYLGLHLAHDHQGRAPSQLSTHYLRCHNPSIHITTVISMQLSFSSSSQPPSLPPPSHASSASAWDHRSSPALAGSSRPSRPAQATAAL